MGASRVSVALDRPVLKVLDDSFCGRRYGAPEKGRYAVIP
jgi:hypothetical protein